jgi:hypothetical protein
MRSEKKGGLKVWIGDHSQDLTVARIEGDYGTPLVYKQ